MNPRHTLSMIQLKGSNLYVGHYIIPLHGRKKMHQLILALFAREEGLSRKGIRKIIYRNEDESLLSLRLIDSQDASLSKLISRSRRHLKITLADTPWAKAIDWFVYDDVSKLWHLTVVKGPHPLPSLPREQEVSTKYFMKGVAR